MSIYLAGTERLPHCRETWITIHLTIYIYETNATVFLKTIQRSNNSLIWKILFVLEPEIHEHFGKFSYILEVFAIKQVGQ